MNKPLKIVRMCVHVYARIKQAHNHVLCRYITDNSTCLFFKDFMLVRDLRMKLLE